MEYNAPIPGRNAGPRRTNWQLDGNDVLPNGTSTSAAQRALETVTVHRSNVAAKVVAAGSLATVASGLVVAVSTAIGSRAADVTRWGLFGLGVSLAVAAAAGLVVLWNLAAKNGNADVASDGDGISRPRGRTRRSSPPPFDRPPPAAVLTQLSSERDVTI